MHISKKRRVRLAECVFALLAVPLITTRAAPGDLQLEVISQTDNPGSGPGGVAFEQILTTGSGFEFPVSIDNSGSLIFAATTLVEGIERRGLFKGSLGGSPERLFQIGQNVPGVLQNDEPVVSMDFRVFGSSGSGVFQALPLSDFERYLYRVEDGVIESTPIAWGETLSKTRNFDGPVMISDGRGESRTFGMDGSINKMAVSDSGVIIWESTFGGTSTFFRASSKDDIVAIAFEGTDAPGFDAGIEAKLDAPWTLRGIDQSGNSYFVARIMNSGSTFRAVYRHNASDNSLTLLYPVPGKPLEGLSESSVVNLQEEDVAILDDGAVFLRGSINNGNTGFWKREADGEFVQVILMNENSGTETDQGTVGFRSVAVDFADWAVAKDHSIFFTADVRTGASGINQEGVWKIDATTGAVTTIARAPLNGMFGDAPGTDATYGAILDIAAAGDGAVVFSCELSDGSKGLFATDTNGGVVKLAIEGDRMAIEDGRLVEKTGAEGYAITSFYFTPDVAGEDLGKSQGNWGMNDFAEVAFQVELDSGVGALIKASYEGILLPRGDVYVWNGEAGDTNWHSANDVSSNWEDEDGVSWTTPPNRADARVIIPVGAIVDLPDPGVQVASIFSEGDLSIVSALTVQEDAQFHDLTIAPDADLVLNGSVKTTGEVNGASNGLTTTWTIADQTIESAGSISAPDFGVFATSSAGITIDNSAGITSASGLAIRARAEGGLIAIDNRGDLTSGGGSAIQAVALDGSVTIRSPGLAEGLPEVILSTTDGHGIEVSASESVSVEFVGTVETLSSGFLDPANGIDAISTSGDSKVVGRADISGTGSSTVGIKASSAGTTTVNFEGSIKSDGIGVEASTSGDSILIDVSDTVIAAELSGILASGGSESVTIQSGAVAAGAGAGISVLAEGSISITSTGEVTVIDDSSIQPTNGIEASSENRGIEINHTGEISVLTDFASSAIFARASEDIIVSSEGSLSTFRGVAIDLETEPGTTLFDTKNSSISATHTGDVSTSEGGAGLSLVSNFGSVDLYGPGESDTISTTGEGENGIGIRSRAFNEVNIDWSGNIETEGTGAHAIDVVAGLGEAVVGLFDSDIETSGQDADGVRVEGVSDLNVALVAGSITGGESSGVGVRFTSGAENKLTNFGGIGSLGGTAIQAGVGNETVENFGMIFGDVDLGAGDNLFWNIPDAILYTGETITLGAGNRILNEGVVQIGESGAGPVVTNLTGNFDQTAGGTLRVGLHPSDTSDKLVVLGSSTLSGTLELDLEIGYALKDGESFEVLQSGTLSGAFGKLGVQLGGVGVLPRHFRFEIDQDETSVSVDITAATVTDYGSWLNRFFTPEQVPNDALTDPFADPDGDGISNLFEYVFGTDPQSADREQLILTLLPTDVEGEATGMLTFPWVNDLTDYTWAIDRSVDLETWTRATTSIVDTVSEGDVTRLTVAMDEKVDLSEGIFVRLVLVPTP